MKLIENCQNDMGFRVYHVRTLQNLSKMDLNSMAYNGKYHIKVKSVPYCLDHMSFIGSSRMESPSVELVPTILFDGSIQV